MEQHPGRPVHGSFTSPSSAPSCLYCRLISNHNTAATLSRWETFDLHMHPLHSFVKSPLLSYRSLQMALPLLLLFFFFFEGKPGLHCLQMSLVSAAPTFETNFSIKFISHENGSSWAAWRGGEGLNGRKHKYSFDKWGTKCSKKGTHLSWRTFFFAFGHSQEIQIVFSCLTYFSFFTSCELLLLLFNKHAATLTVIWLLMKLHHHIL